MENLYNIAITEIKGIGTLRAKALIDHFGSAENIFKERPEALAKVQFVGPALASSVGDKNILNKAEKNIEFAHKYGIKILFYKDQQYPTRLAACEDSPLILFYKGNQDLNKSKFVGIVGTRHPSSYGRGFCKEFLSQLKQATPDIITVSGLAIGIDTEAHRQSLENDIPTIAVLAHGLDRIYPPSNRQMAEIMVHNGGVITEFPKDTTPERENFPKRNRIIAGMSDAVIVVESRSKGGSLITAAIADSYNRDVFALPGKTTDQSSKGCNWLLKSRRATMIENAEDFLKEMNWDNKNKNTGAVNQLKMFPKITADEQKIYDMLSYDQSTNIDSIIDNSGMSASRVAGILLNLEFDDLIQSMPGKMYKRV